jgi:hypothetical protein
MDQALLKDVPKSMRRTGMLLFRDAFMEALQGPELMSVIHTAHAAEILLKARIAQEHPLLIFSKLPKADSNQETLTLADLLERGRTLSYEELPDQLWATTGIRIEQINRYREFGRLRNQLVHFSMTNAEALDVITLRYSLEVLDPLVESFWGKSVIDFITKDPHEYYAGFVNSGLFEDSIRKVFVIDARLRRLLGKSSLESWRRMNSYIESSKEYESSKTSEELEAESRDRVTEDDPYITEQYKQYMKDREIWRTFLESF